MPFTPLGSVLPEIARSETRSLLRVEDGEVRRSYLFSESYCDEPGCDCRRVYFLVFSDEAGAAQPRATLCWGWEPSEFYRTWARSPLDEGDLEELRGPALARLAQQSAEASELLAELRTLLANEAYAERIKRHYHAFRAVVDVTGTRTNNLDVEAPASNRADRRRERALRGRRR